MTCKAASFYDICLRSQLQHRPERYFQPFPGDRQRSCGRDLGEGFLI